MIYVLLFSILVLVFVLFNYGQMHIYFDDATTNGSFCPQAIATYGSSENKGFFCQFTT
jgi:hypothetical protein